MPPTPSVNSEVEERQPVTLAYRSELGQMLVGRIEDALTDAALEGVRGKVNLVFTSPPFPLVRKKRYGNESGEKYVEWLKSLAPRLTQLLAPNGSIVVEVGNAWVKGLPVMSTLPIEALLAFRDAADLNVCQQIICHNPARLPSPAVWVNVKRIRLKDSYTHVWWMSPSETPKADNRKVLVPYSPSMKKLLKRKSYNSGRRPSGHVVSETGFLTNHGGAIAANVIDITPDQGHVPTSLLQFTGTAWDAQYRDYCAKHDLPAHPARMQADLAAFFIQFLTDPGDLVVDPFAGSNTTGAVAEQLGRRWIGVEAKDEYAEGSKGRFDPKAIRASARKPSR